MIASNRDDHMPQVSNDLAEPPEGSDGGLCVFGRLGTDWRARFGPRTKRAPAPSGAVEVWSHRLIPMLEATPPETLAPAGWATIETRTTGRGTTPLMRWGVCATG